MLDAVIVGSGPNGLVAAGTLAAAGKRGGVLEAEATIGGGARTAELTLPGVRHDVCASVHPLGAGSPVMAALHLTGLAWVHPDIAMAHPLDDGSAASPGTGSTLSALPSARRSPHCATRSPVRGSEGSPCNPLRGWRAGSAPHREGLSWVGSPRMPRDR